MCAKQGLTRPPLPTLLPQSDLAPRPTSPASTLSTIRRMYVTIPEYVPLQCRLAVKPGLFRSWSALLLLITAPHRWCIDKESGIPAIKAGIRNMLTTHGLHRTAATPPQSSHILRYWFFLYTFLKECSW